MRWGALIASIVLLLMACAPAEQPPAAAPAPAPEAPPAAPAEPAPEPASEPTTVTVETPPAEPAAEEGVYERPPEEPPSIAKFLSLFKNEVKNYKFTYKGDTWLVEGTKAKILPFRILQNEYHAPYIDTIYLDLGRRTAVGVCEGRDTNIKKQCAIRQTLGKQYALPYVQFKITLPEDWLVEFQNLYVTLADTPRLVTDRETIHLKHSTKTRTTDLFIDPSSGLPVAVIDNGIEYHYDHLAKNQLGPGETVVPR